MRWRKSRPHPRRPHLAKLSGLERGPQDLASRPLPASAMHVEAAVRSRPWGFERRAEISQCADLPLLPGTRSFRRGDPSFGEGVTRHARGYERRRHLRSSRRRLRALFDRRRYGSCRISRRCSTTTRKSSVLALVHSLWPDPTFAEPDAGDVSAGCMREMRVGDCLCRLPRRADQDGEEGLFYVWEEEEVDAPRLSDAAKRSFKAAYDVTRGGNWEDRTVLRRITRQRGSPDGEAGLAASRGKLFALREARPKPGRDDKVRGGLERPDHRRARSRQRGFRRTGVA